MCSLSTALKSPDVDFFLHKNKVLHSDVAGVLGHRLGETGTMEHLYFFNAFFCYPAIMYFTAGVAGVAGVFSALHQMWKASCKQGKKKCGFIVCCRECIPAWWGALVKTRLMDLR